MKRKLSTLLVVLGVLAGMALPAGADPNGYFEAEMGVGYFYGEFGPGPNLLLFVGGTAAEFCLNNPEDPFNAEPGIGTFRFYERHSGALDIKADHENQPAYLYEFDGEASDLLFATCAALFDGNPSTNPVEPFASGSVNLKVRLGIQAVGTVDVFNSVNGTVSATDGTQWKVRAWADLVIVNDAPVGNPADFVHLEVHQIGS
jgi:hypothetical protein